AAATIAPMDDLSEPLPHPAPEECAEALRLVEAWALHHHATLREQPIGRTATPTELRPRLAGPPPDDGRPFPDVLAQFRRQVPPFAFNVMHPRFLAFIPGAPSFPSVLCACLTSP